jgi:uncharacterized OB-fold protein
VYSATTVHKAPSPEFHAPFILVIVDFEEGWSMLATFVGDSAPEIGTPVEVTWTQRGGRILPAFTGAPA